MDKSRRSFLKKMFIGLGTTVVGGTIISHGGKLSPSSILGLSSASDSTNQVHQTTPDDPNRHWGFLIDLSKCDGCTNSDPPNDDPTGERPLCSYACRISHYYLLADPPQYWIRVYEKTENDYTDPFFFPKPCMNCENPPCLRVCPTGATFKRKDGTVLINHTICIGCRMCMASCPYETRFFWYKNPIYKDENQEREVKSIEYSPEHPLPHLRGTVVKCDFCLHMAYDGYLPSCVTACPNGALYYGDLHQDAVSNGTEVIALKDTLEKHGGFRYKEEEHTKPSVFYLPPAFGERSTLRLQIIVIPEHLGKKTEIKVKVDTKYGVPVQSAHVRVLKESTFGRVTIANGKSDSSGIFNFIYDITKLKGQSIIAEVIDPNKHVRNMVRKNV